MATAKRTAEIDSLRDRVEELERQLERLKAAVDCRQGACLPPQCEMPEEEAQEYHESSLRMMDDIRKEREKDRAKINREMDRRERREKKLAAKVKSTRARPKARKAG